MATMMSDDLKLFLAEKVIEKQKEEISALRARVARLEEALKDAERVLGWGEPELNPVLGRVRRALEEK